MKTRVTDVHKPLLAVYDMCMAGQRVVFEIRKGVNLSYAEHVGTGGSRRLSCEIEFGSSTLKWCHTVRSIVRSDTTDLMPNRCALFTGRPIDRKPR